MIINLDEKSFDTLHDRVGEAVSKVEVTYAGFDSRNSIYQSGLVVFYFENGDRLRIFPAKPKITEQGLTHALTICGEEPQDPIGEVLNASSQIKSWIPNCRSTLASPLIEASSQSIQIVIPIEGHTARIGVSLSFMLMDVFIENDWWARLFSNVTLKGGWKYEV